MDGVLRVVVGLREDRVKSLKFSSKLNAINAISLLSGRESRGPHNATPVLWITCSRAASLANGRHYTPNDAFKATNTGQLVNNAPVECLIFFAQCVFLSDKSSHSFAEGTRGLRFNELSDEWNILPDGSV